MNAQEVRLTLTLDQARALLHWFGDTNLGIDPGHFVTRLLALISCADDENKEILRGHWPELVYGFEKVQRTPWGLDWVRGIVKAGNPEDGLSIFDDSLERAL